MDKRQFADMGAGSNYLLVCVWASWMQQPGLDARKSLDSLLDVISPAWRERNKKSE